METKIKSINVKKLLFWLFLMAVPAVVTAISSISSALNGFKLMIKYDYYDVSVFSLLVSYALSLLLSVMTFTRPVLHKNPKLHKTLKIIVAVILGIMFILKIVSYISNILMAFIPESQYYPLIYLLVNIYSLITPALMLVIFSFNKMSNKTKLILTIICIAIQVLPLASDMVAMFQGNAIIEIIGALTIIETAIRGLFNIAIALLVQFFALAPLKEKAE